MSPAAIRAIQARCCCKACSSKGNTEGERETLLAPCWKFNPTAGVAIELDAGGRRSPSGSASDSAGNPLVSLRGARSDVRGSEGRLALSGRRGRQPPPLGPFGSCMRGFRLGCGYSSQFPPKGVRDAVGVVIAIFWRIPGEMPNTNPERSSARSFVFMSVSERLREECFVLSYAAQATEDSPPALFFKGRWQEMERATAAPCYSL